MQSFTVQQRRRLLVSRHRLTGDADDPIDVVRHVVALHATDPATVYLSVLARCAASTIYDVARAMYERRSLVRWLAMRRTLFVFDRADVPMVHAAIGSTLAPALRRQLVSRLRRNGTDPPLVEDPARWLERVGDATVDALRHRSTATGTQLGADEPALRTTILAGAPSDRPQHVTTGLLTVLGAEGRVVRGAPTGSWTTRQHRWEPVERWWPDGVPALDDEQARRHLARRWLAGFGPATVEDLQWWTGWNRTVTRRVVAALAAEDLEEVDLHGRVGIALAGTAEQVDNDAGGRRPVAALLPALDPTPMGWKERDWFLDVDPRRIYDAAGNIGPTVWWDGRIVGGWSVAATGEVRTAVLADIGADGTRAVGAAADALHARLDGAVVTPAVRTPLEQDLRRGG